MADDKSGDLSDKNAGVAEKEEESLSFSFSELVTNDVEHLTSKLLSLRLSQWEDHDIADFVNKKDDENRTPLHIVAINNEVQGYFELAEILLNNGADPNAKDKFGRTPLWYLFQNQADVEILKLFYKFKADFVNAGKDETSSLLKLVMIDNLDLDLHVLKFLIQDVGLDLNHRDEDEKTLLHNIAEYKYEDCLYDVLEYLLENGSDVNARDNHGFTPIWYLVQGGGDIRVVKLFLKHKADLNSVSKNGRSILFAFDQNYFDLQILDKLICDFELNVNQTDFDQMTPLHFFLDNFELNQLHSKIMKCLLKNGANINAPDKYGITPAIEVIRIIDRLCDEWVLENFDSFKFIINQMDFSVVHNYNNYNIHIFNEYEYEDEDLPESKYLWKWILEHLAKLEFLSIPIHPIVREFIEDHFFCKDYFLKCIKEMEVMSNTKPQNSWINFFNILIDDRKKLKNYAGNQNLIRDFENKDWLKMFPIYGAEMKKKMERGIKRRELFDKSSILLSNYLPIFNPNHLIVKDIFDCVLSKKDLSKFCESLVIW